MNDPLLLHKRVCESGLPNYMGIRVPFATDLNIANWRRFLVDYWDDQLVVLLEFGFPSDFDRSFKLISVEDNHKSAKDYEEHVNHYLQEELQHGAILGPFKNKPINLHVSPLMTSQSWGLTSRSTARVILGQVLSIATCGTRTHRGDSL